MIGVKCHLGSNPEGEAGHQHTAQAQFPYWPVLLGKRRQEAGSDFVAVGGGGVGWEEWAGTAVGDLLRMK